MTGALNRKSRIGIVIPTPSEGNDNIKRCLESIDSTTSDLNVEIQVIVDSGSGFRFSKSINTGIQRSSACEGWVLVNDDCTFSDDWLGKMLDASECNPEAGLIGAVIVDNDNNIDHAGGFLTTTFNGAIRESWRGGMYSQMIRMPFRNVIFRRKLSSIEPFHHRSVNPSNRLDFLTGACLLVTKRLHDTIGEWDEKYRFTWEDTDYSLRALNNGFELCLSTESVVFHQVRATGRKWGPETWESGKIFRKKWKRGKIEGLTRGRLGIYF